MTAAPLDKRNWCDVMPELKGTKICPILDKHGNPILAMPYTTKVVGHWTAVDDPIECDFHGCHDEIAEAERKAREG